MHLSRTVAVAILLVTSPRAQRIQTSFDSPIWPSAATVTWSHTQTQSHSGLTITYQLTRWQLSSGDASLPFSGGQGGLVQASNGLTSELLLSNVPDPVAVRFKIAAQSVAPATGPSDWTLRLHAINAGMQELEVGSWSNLYGVDVPAHRVWSVKTARILVPQGVYQLRFRLEPRPGLAAPPPMAFDHLEVFLAPEIPPEDPLPLSTLTQDLNSSPAVVPMPDETRIRRQCLHEQLDRWAAAEHSKYTSSRGVAGQSQFTDWYRRRMRETVNHLQTCTPGIAEACISKLYSSGYIVHTRDGTFAVDLTEGPNALQFTPASGVALAIELAVLVELGQILDLSLVTHHHYDHCFYPLIEFMQTTGKPAVGSKAIDPTDGVSLFEYFQLAAPSYVTQSAGLQAMIDPPLTHQSDITGISIPGLPGWTLRTFKGRQAMDPNDPCGFVNGTHEDPINYSYHITTRDGLKFLVVGDHRDHFHYANSICAADDPILTLNPNNLGWWPRLDAAGVSVDIKLGAGPLIHWLWRARMQGHFGPFVSIEGHEWEMLHPGINRVATFWRYDSPNRETTVPLSLGERLHYKAFPSPPSITQLPSGATAVSMTTALPTKEVTVHYKAVNSGTGNWLQSTLSHPVPSWTHSVQITGLTSQSQYCYYVTTKTFTPGITTTPSWAGSLHDGPHYGSTTESMTFVAP